jgi:hypothetical protein
MPILHEQSTNLGHLVKVLWKHLNNTNTKGSPLCDVMFSSIIVMCVLFSIGLQLNTFQDYI